MNVADRVKETTVTAGFGAVTLAGAVAGYQSFASVLTNGQQCHYTIAHRSAAEWEVGLGTWSAGVLTRTTVYSSSNANAVVTFSAGTKDVMLVWPAYAARLQSWLALPDIKRADFQISEATLRTLFSAPPTLLPAVAGVSHQPVYSHWFREAGSAYTFNGSVNLQFKRTGVVMDSQPVGSLFGGAGPYTRMMLHDMLNGGASPYGADGVITSGRDDTNQAVTLAGTVANWSGGTGKLFLALFYRDWTNVALPLAPGTSYTLL